MDRRTVKSFDCNIVDIGVRSHPNARRESARPHDAPIREPVAIGPTARPMHTIVIRDGTGDLSCWTVVRSSYKSWFTRSRSARPGFGAFEDHESCRIRVIGIGGIENRAANHVADFVVLAGLPRLRGVRSEGKSGISFPDHFADLECATSPRIERRRCPEWLATKPLAPIAAFEQYIAREPICGLDDIALRSAQARRPGAKARWKGVRRWNVF